MNFNDIYNRLLSASSLEEQNNIINELHDNTDIYDSLHFSSLMELIIKLNKGTKEISSQFIFKIIEPYMNIPIYNCFFYKFFDNLYQYCGAMALQLSEINLNDVPLELIDTMKNVLEANNKSEISISNFSIIYFKKAIPNFEGDFLDGVDLSKISRNFSEIFNANYKYASKVYKNYYEQNKTPISIPVEELFLIDDVERFIDDFGFYFEIFNIHTDLIGDVPLDDFVIMDDIMRENGLEDAFLDEKRHKKEILDILCEYFEKNPTDYQTSADIKEKILKLGNKYVEPEEKKSIQVENKVEESTVDDYLLDPNVSVADKNNFLKSLINQKYSDQVDVLVTKDGYLLIKSLHESQNNNINEILDFLKQNRLVGNGIIIPVEQIDKYVGQIVNSENKVSVYLVDTSVNYTPNRKKFHFPDYERVLSFYDGVANYINRYDLSPVEKYIFAYYLTANFKKYKMHEDNTMSELVEPSLSRDPFMILLNEAIVCAGYAHFLEKVLEKVDIPCSFVANRNLQHAFNMVNIIDPKYGIDSYFISDPTADNFKGKIRNAFHSLEGYADFANKVYLSKLSFEELFEDADEKHLVDAYKKVSGIPRYYSPKTISQKFTCEMDESKIIEILRNVFRKVAPFMSDLEIEAEIKKITSDSLPYNLKGLGNMVNSSENVTVLAEHLFSTVNDMSINIINQTKDPFYNHLNCLVNYPGVSNKELYEYLLSGDNPYNEIELSYNEEKDELIISFLYEESFESYRDFVQLIDIYLNYIRFIVKEYKLEKNLETEITTLAIPEVSPFKR